jgi:hypothetical protein
MVMESLTTDVPHLHVPVLVNNGVVVCQGPSGGMTTVTLRTHDAVSVRTCDCSSQASPPLLPFPLSPPAASPHSR